MVLNSKDILQNKLVSACEFIETSDQIPSLSEVAAHCKFSAAYFQKIFSKFLGISPKNYADAVRFKRLRLLLKKGASVSRALYDAGFGSSSRLYEFAHRYLGMSPKHYQNKGQGATILYVITQSPLGYLLVAATDQGICCVRLGEKKKKLERELKKEFQGAKFLPKSVSLQRWVQALVDYLKGHRPWPLLPYDIQATAFQKKVWDWLRTIPSGKTYHYSEAAKALGNPSAARAVARACATNPIAIVIPCHRIVPKSGGVGGYRWNPDRKKRLLNLEMDSHRRTP